MDPYDIPALMEARWLRQAAANRPEPPEGEPPEGQPPKGQPPKGKQVEVEPGALRAINGETLMEMVFAPLRWIVPGFLPEGLTLLSGRPKVGKSWLALDLAIAVAAGGSALASVPCEQGDVLYIDLENGRRRFQRRVATLYEGRQRPRLFRLAWFGCDLPFDQRFFPALEDWRKTSRQPRLVVVDALPRVKPAKGYRNHAAVLAALQRWAAEYDIAVLVVQHSARSGADRFAGLPASADTALVLAREASGFTLSLQGRDVEESESALAFEAGRWSLLGEAGSARRSAERTAILTALREVSQSRRFPGGLSPADIAAATGMKGANVRRLLFSMTRDGEVRNGTHGYLVARDDPSGNAGNAMARHDGQPSSPRTSRGEDAGRQMRGGAGAADFAPAGDTDSDIDPSGNAGNAARVQPSSPRPELVEGARGEDAAPRQAREADEGRRRQCRQRDEARGMAASITPVTPVTR